MIRIIIVDDEILSRIGLQSFLDGKEGIVVSGIFGEAEEALHFLEENVVDIVLIIIRFVKSVISHLDHHMAHQFQKDMSAENAERPFSEDIIIALIVPKD